MSKKSSPKTSSIKTEFVDEEGNKWIQTSTEDLFSTREMKEIFNSIERDKETGEIILARIDFQRVNKDYYDKVMDLQSELKRKNEKLRKVLLESQKIIEKKNAKMKEMIEYIKELHLLLACYNLSPEKTERIQFVPQEETPAQEPRKEYEPPVIPYTEVQEIPLDGEGEEIIP